MAHGNETARTAVCDQDTIKLRKMGEELDAAAEYIEHLQAVEPDHSKCGDQELVLSLREELDLAKADLIKNSETIVLLGTENADLIEAAKARPVIDQQERKDRGALLQVVYNLQRDNPDMSLEEGLVYISGAFAGESDTPILDAVEPLDLEPEIQAEETWVEDDPEPDAEIVDAINDWGLDAELTDSLGQLDFTDNSEISVWLPPKEDDPDGELFPDNQQGYESFPDNQLDYEPWAPPKDEENYLTEAKHGTAEEEQENLEEVIDKLPAPVSATEIVEKPKPKPRKKKSVPSGPDDTEWDPSQFVPKPDEASKLNELLERIEPRAEELYGIKAFAKAHPELLQKPQK